MSDILTGPIAERQNYSRHLMTAAEARGIIRDMENQVSNATKRRSMATFYAKNIAGMLSDEAISVYQAYAVKK